MGAQPHRSRQPGAEGAVPDHRSPRRCSAALDATDEGRAFRQQLDEFLFEYGWRHDAVYDLADVPWREDPSIPLASIATMMKLDDSEDPEVIYQQKVAKREELLANARAKLADEPETLAKFDELYEAAQYSFPLTEDHAFYIDQLFISVFRRFVPRRRRPAGGQGRHRPARRRLLPLPRRGGRRPHRRRRPAGLVAERRASLERASQAEAPTTLGTPPPPPEAPDPFMDALVFRLLGMVPPRRTRPRCAQGRGRVAGRLHRHGPGGALAGRGDRRSRTARSWSAR